MWASALLTHELIAVTHVFRKSMHASVFVYVTGKTSYTKLYFYFMWLLLLLLLFLLPSFGTDTDTKCFCGQRAPHTHDTDKSKFEFSKIITYMKKKMYMNWKLGDASVVA